MPVKTEKGNLARAVRNGKSMLDTIKDSYESGHPLRMQAALELAREFQKDVESVIVPLLEAAKAAKNGEGQAHA